MTEVLLGVVFLSRGSPCALYTPAWHRGTKVTATRPPPSSCWHIVMALCASLYVCLTDWKPILVSTRQSWLHRVRSCKWGQTFNGRRLGKYLKQCLLTVTYSQYVICIFCNNIGSAQCCVTIFWCYNFINSIPHWQYCFDLIVLSQNTFYFDKERIGALCLRTPSK